MPTISDPRTMEVMILRNKLVDIENQIKEARKAKMRISAESDKKSSQLDGTEADIAAEIERFRWKREELIRRNRIIHDEGSERLEAIHRKQKELIERVGAADVIEMQNETLREQLRRLSSQQFQQSLKHHEDIEKRKQVAFDTRMQMEEILRKTIKHFDNEYQLKAIEKMEAEAAQAKMENLRLFVEFEKREKQAVELIKTQQQSYDRFMKSKVAVDVFSANYVMHTTIGKNMLVACLDRERELKDIISKTELCQREVQDLVHKCEYKRLLEADLVDITKELNAVVEERRALSQKTINTCHTMLKESLDVARKQRIIKNKRIQEGFKRLVAETKAEATDEAVALLSPPQSPQMVRIASPDNSVATGSDASSHMAYSIPGFDIFALSPSTVASHRNQQAPVGEVGPNNADFDADNVWKADRTDVHMLPAALRKLVRDSKGKGKDRILLGTSMGVGGGGGIITPMPMPLGIIKPMTHRSMPSLQSPQLRDSFSADGGGGGIGGTDQSQQLTRKLSEKGMRVTNSAPHLRKHLAAAITKLEKLEKMKMK